MSAETAEHAGTPQLKQFHMVNTKMWYHPKYYKNLRKLARLRNRVGSIDGAMLPDSQSDQAISSRKTVDVGDSVRPGPGLKQQASSNKPQAPSNKRSLE